MVKGGCALETISGILHHFFLSIHSKPVSISHRAMLVLHLTYDGLAPVLWSVLSHCTLCDDRGFCRPVRHERFGTKRLLCFEPRRPSLR